MEADVQPERDGGRTGFGRRNDRVARHPLPPRKSSFLRLAGLLGLAVLTGLLQARALAAVAVLAPVLLLAVLLPWLAVRGVRARWDYPLRRGQVGKPLPVRLVLRSRLPWPGVGLLIRGGWADPLSKTDPLTVAVPRIPAWCQREVTTTLTPSQRGVFPSAQATLATGFPFGVWRVRPAASGGQVLIWPEIVSLTGPARDAGRRPHGEAQRMQRGIHHGDFHGTRPYRAGESLRRIHWKQSARHDELIVWEAGAVAQAAVVLLLETAAEVHSVHEDGSSLEKTLSIGASLAWGLVERGVHVTLSFEPTRFFSVGSLRQLEVALDAMARFAPDQGASHGALLAQMAPRVVRLDEPWLVTTVAGWQRAANHPLAGRLKAIVIDERQPEEKALNPDLPVGRGMLIPLADTGHQQLRRTWEEVSLGLQTVV